MEKKRGSSIGKVIAWILFIISVTVATLSTVVMMCNYSIGVYSGENIGSIMANTFENINRRYSLEVWRERSYSSVDMRSKMYEKGFRYGIIETDDISDIDLNDEDSYLDTNFFIDDAVGNIDKDNLYLYRLTSATSGNSTSVSSTYSGSYNDYLYNRTTNVNADEDYQWVGLYADAVCYDEVGGIFYYRAEGDYYPVQNVSFYFDNMAYNYTYDFYKEMYLFDNSSYQTDVVQDYAPTPELTTEGENGYSYVDVASISKILRNGLNFDGYLTFDFMYDYNCPCEMWYVVMDDIREIEGADLTKIYSTTISDSNFIKETGYYLNEYYTLMVKKNLNDKTYYVVSIIPNNVSAYLYGNEYERNMQFLSIFYDSRLFVICVALGSAVIAIIMLISLMMSTSGYIKGSAKIPFDLWSVIMLAAFGGIMSFLCMNINSFINLVSAYSDINNWEIIVPCIVVGTVVASALMLWYIIDLTARVKNGKWWQNTICYRIINCIKNAIARFWGNIGLIWKYLVIVAAVIVVRIWILVMYTYRVNRVLVVSDITFAIVMLLVGIGIIIKFGELQRASSKLAQGDLSYKIDTSKMHFEFKEHGENLNMISEGMAKAVEARIKSERFKTELITNVSHDIKTPLTSIINYVDLLEKEELNNDKATEYLEVLERQSSKLKKLIEDLVEASKASSGNLTVNNEKLDAGVFITQTVGEFEEKLAAAGLELIVNKPAEPVYIMADGRHLWRVVDNIMNNICKYAQPQSRVYVSLEAGENATITFKNMSKYQLNVSGEDLMERFTRGDKSRNTEGHGLGLSIALSLVTLMKGDMNIVVDGDLFKVIIRFDKVIAND